MTHPSKRKGNGFERELVQLARDSGLTSERAYASNGRALGCVEAVDLTIDDKRIQAKRRACLPAYLQLPDGCDAVVFRQDRGTTLVLIDIYEYLDLLKSREAKHDAEPSQTRDEMSGL
jgi:Holliday junction resolvase